MGFNVQNIYPQYQNSLPQLGQWNNASTEVRADFLEAKQAANRGQLLDQQVSNNPFSANTEQKKDKMGFFNSPAWYAMGVIPTARRVQSLPYRLFVEKDTVGSALQGAQALFNGPGDLVQLSLTGQYIKELAQKGYKAMGKRLYQREFTLLRGSIIDGKFKYLENLDYSLFDTKFGKGLLKTCGVNFDIDDMRLMPATKNGAAKFLGVNFKQGFAKNVLGRTLLRTSTLGLGLSGVFEIPKIIKSFTETEGNLLDKGKALCGQLVKSASYVGIINLGIAAAGAIAFPYGMLAELGAMAVGSAISLELVKSLNNKVDNIFENPEKQTIPVNFA